MTEEEKTFEINIVPCVNVPSPCDDYNHRINVYYYTNACIVNQYMYMFLRRCFCSFQLDTLNFAGM